MSWSSLGPVVAWTYVAAECNDFDLLLPQYTTEEEARDAAQAATSKSGCSHYLAKIVCTELHKPSKGEL